MDGYTSIFSNAENEYGKITVELEGFRYKRHIYGFCINEDIIDQESLDYSKKINNELYEKFILQPKSLAGYKDNEEKYCQLDDVDCKHIMELIFLFNNNETNYNKIVEIGAGYGNMCRLCNNIINYNSWDIFDIPHMLEVQKYFLTDNNIDISKINFNTAYNIHTYENIPIDLVIATHSVSELSWDNFIIYFYNVIKYSKFFYYGYNTICPSRELIEMKLSHIQMNGFEIYKNLEYREKQGANVNYILYKNIQNSR
jgi:hypothetical protein